MKRRLGTAVLAILLALLGTAGVLGYVREANVRALAGQKAETVLVATQMIPAGTSAGLAQTDGWLRQETFPVASIPPGAIGLLSGSISGLVVNAQVQPGELLLRPMLVRAVQSANGLAIPTGMVMTTLQLCLSQAVAGYIHPGSEVAVFETVGTGTITQSNCSPTTEQLKNVRTQVVLPKVLVLAVGPAADEQQPAPRDCSRNRGDRGRAVRAGQRLDGVDLDD